MSKDIENGFKIAGAGVKAISEYQNMIIEVIDKARKEDWYDCMGVIDMVQELQFRGNEILREYKENCRGEN